MKESVHPLEISLGMEYYATNTPGTGGRLKAHAEDFIVEEEPCEVGSDGPYLICRLTKREWELQRAVKEISKILGISHRRIGWTGTKPLPGWLCGRRHRERPEKPLNVL